MLRRSINNKKEKQLFIKRFYPAGTYTWTVPAGCTEVDVFLVGGGSAYDSGNKGNGGISDYTEGRGISRYTQYYGGGSGGDGTVLIRYYAYKE